MVHTKKVAILQSNYIPWKGYFDIMANADVFVLFDDRQYTKRDWRNRNKIKTPKGHEWLTIPIKTKGNHTQKINEVEVLNNLWTNKHLKSLEIYYSKAEFFNEVMTWLTPLFSELKNIQKLSEINKLLILGVNEWLNVQTEIIDADNLKIEGRKNQALLSVIQQIDHATHYISGPSAKSYLDEGLFAENNIKVEWMDYSNYPKYKQLYPPFIHEVSILDLLFNEGPNSPQFLKFSYDEEA